MCGIAGIVGIDPDPAIVTKMTGALFHRGPDHSGFYHNRIASVGIQRLSIVDIAGGDQPIFNEDGTAAIVFNGEIYNHVELRTLLQSKGHRFRSATDSEVILHLYEEYGEDCLRYLRGMFAFAIVRNEDVFIARDRLGIKPLYYAVPAGSNHFLFGSEIKALLQHPQLSVTINASALADRRILRHFTREQTIFEEIKALAPGHYLKIRVLPTGLDVRTHCFHAISLASSHDVTLPEAVGEFNQLFQRAVERHLQGDLPVGITLSGGLDSSLLAHFIKHNSAQIGPAFTISCSPRSGDSISARNLAQQLGFRHIEVKPTFEEYCSMIPACVLAEEAIPSLYALPFLILCQNLSGHLKVCLNGEGSDELFAGYDDYSQPSLTIRRLRHALAEAELAGLPVSARAKEVTARICGTRKFNEYLSALLETYQLEQLEYNHLLIVDRYSMAYSVEMRVPFMDDDVVAYVNSLPLRLKLQKELSISKYLLKHVALQACGPELRDATLRSKVGMPSSGFNYLMKFNDFCDNSIPDDFAESHAYRAFFCETDRGGRIRGKAGLLLFDLFCYFFVEHRGIAPKSFSFSEFLEERLKQSARDWLQSGEEISRREAYARG